MRQIAHIGYPKCGSTWLQTHVFPKHAEIFLLGRGSGDSIIDDDVRLFLWSDLIDCNEFSHKKERFHRFSDSYVEEAHKRGAKAICLSSEIITNGFIGGLDLPVRAARLKNFMPDAKILMVIREQVSWITSAYSMLVKECGGTCPIEEYAEWFLHESDRSPLSWLFYDRVMDVYGELFGPENIHVVTFETLKSDPADFVTDVLEAIGVSPDIRFPIQAANESPDTVVLEQLRRMNIEDPFRFGAETLITRPFGAQAAPVFTSLSKVDLPQKYVDQRERYRRNMRFKPDDVAPGERISIPEHIKTELRRIYAPHNDRLQEQTGLSLEKFSYALPGML